jgi:FKBP-type peptidyl-prolyl cis-trans isomerase FkpA
MSSVTAVPLRPIRKGALALLWGGLALITAVGAAGAYYGTKQQVAMAQPASDMLAKNGKRSGVVTTASGLQYEVLKAGNGPKPSATDVVLVEYEGKLANGEVFDASARHGGPATLPVGGLIPGWVEGLQLMNQGSKVRFWIPPELGYGEQGAGNGEIPPNALLVFDVELLAIAPPGMGGMPGMGAR